ncbi:MAG: four helix bundle protein [Saprospiraceae bacterium]|nr:four helix bundle protein [Saprospiraceae bacterium]
MKIQKFEDLKIWQKSIQLATKIYQVTEANSDHSFSNQLRRASVSISNNIAEGFDRPSNKDFIRFLVISKGSLNEVKSMIYLGTELKYLKEEQKIIFLTQTSELQKMIWALINHLKTNSK